ncbi:MAG: DUF1302 family protein [Pseudomonadota bacterium]
MKSGRYWAMVLWGILVGLVLVPGMSRAGYLDDDRTLELRGKFQTKFTVKTQDSTGWSTVPSNDPRYWPDAPDLDAGDLIQQRNIAYIEFDYKPRPSSSEWDMKFHATARFLYDTIYDIGPSEITHVRDFSPTYKDQIDEMSKDADIWECYTDITRGPLFLRIGRQKISWGETDIYPLLDRIMPIDNTYGGMFEDLDDRRIPLWALRGTYNLGSTGPLDDLGIEAFWEPAMLDQKFAPQTPWGSVYNFPQASGPPMQLIPSDPDDDMENSRWGIRFQAVAASNFNFALAYFRSYPVDPALQSSIDFAKLMTGDTRGLQVEKHWIPTDTVGASFSFFEPRTEAVFRGEVAYTFDEPYFDPSKNFRTLYEFMGGSPAPGQSEIPEWDVLRFSLAFDRPFWFRGINKLSMINWTVEVSNEYYPDYDANHVLPAPVYPTGDWVRLHQWEHTFLTMLYTSYMNGRLEPNITVAYNPRGAGFWQSSLQYRMDPVILKVQYTDVFGKKDIAPGVLYDWDQLAVSITMNF